MTYSNAVADMQGIGTNPGLLLRAADYCNSNASLVYGASYLDGKAVRATEHGQVIMETGWLPRGLLNNLVSPTVYMESNGTSRAEVVMLTIFKRLPGTIGVQEAKQVFIKYRTNVSNTVGAVPYNSWVNRPATAPLWFDIRYEYKFKLEVSKLSNGKYIDVEGIYLQYNNSNMVQAAEQVTFGSAITQAVPVMDGIYWSATSDGAGVIDWILTPRFIDGAGNTTGDYKGLFNSVDGAITGFAYGTTFDSSTQIQTDVAASSFGGGYDITVYVYAYTANTIAYFYTMVYGWQNAQVV
jgi:hypothetical protein